MRILQHYNFKNWFFLSRSFSMLKKQYLELLYNEMCCYDKSAEKLP